MSKTVIDVAYVAELARLELTDEEKAVFQPQLENIVTYVEKISAVDVSDIPPTMHGRAIVNALREAKADVLGIVSIFTYGMKKGLERLAEAGVENHSLTNFDVITRVAADEGYIRAEDVDRLIAFRDNPSDESWIK